MTDDYLTVTTIESPEAVVVLTAAGEIDRDSVHLIEEAAEGALARGRVRLVLDLAETTFCDSAGLAFFLELRKKTTAGDGALHIACVHPAVLAVLRITNLDRLFPLHPSVEDAIKAAATDA